MAKKYKFTALPVSSSLQKKEYGSLAYSTLEGNNSLDEEIFNLSELNLVSLTKSLSKSVNKGLKLFHFTQRRENERITLKIEHIRLLQRALQEMKKLGKEIMEIQADNYLTPEIIKGLIDNKRIDIKQAIELKIERHKTNLNSERLKREKEELEILDRKADLALKQAKVALLNARTAEQLQMAELMKQAAEDFKSLPTGAKLSIFHDYMNKHKNYPDTGETKDYDFEEFLKGYKKNIFNETLKQEQAKTKSNEAQADFDKFKTDKKTGKV